VRYYTKGIFFCQVFFLKKSNYHFGVNNKMPALPNI